MRYNRYIPVYAMRLYIKKLNIKKLSSKGQFQLPKAMCAQLYVPLSKQNGKKLMEATSL